jgi:Mn2+/Fe2+ NRAMP family transporter
MTIKEFFIKNYKWFIGIIISIIGTIAVPLIIFFFQKKKKEKERSKNFKIEQ